MLPPGSSATLGAMKIALLLAFLLLPALVLFAQDAAKPAPPATFEAFAMKALRQARAESKKAYLPFLERSSLSTGLYHLPKGARDGQSPHTQDEVYYVLNGRGKFTAGEETVDVAPGQVLFVAAKVEHRFQDISEDIDLLVFFSAAEPMTREEQGK